MNLCNSKVFILKIHRLAQSEWTTWWTAANFEQRRDVLIFAHPIQKLIYRSICDQKLPTFSGKKVLNGSQQCTVFWALNNRDIPNYWLITFREWLFSTKKSFMLIKITFLLDNVSSLILEGNPNSNTIWIHKLETWKTARTIGPGK